MKILTAQQLKRVDQITLEKENITSIELMERAANTCAEWIIKHYKTHHNFYIFCGSGNNGGDGLAIARILKLKHYIVSVFIVSNAAYSDEFEENFERWQKTGAPTKSLHSDDDFPDLSNKNIVIIDALFGIGLNREVKGLTATLINTLNHADNDIISIDIPSGLHADNNATNLHAPIIRATHTLTFELPKIALLLPENQEFSGSLNLLSIGLNQNAIAQQESNYEWVTATYFQNRIQKRNKFSHKGTFGHVKIVAGSLGKIGAAILSSKAALRTGAGLVTAEIPYCGYTAMQTANPEVMVIPNGEKHLDKRIDLNDYHIAIGPGIGINEDTEKETIRLISRTTEPLVIDADALNILAEHKEDWDKIPRFSILTPHPKELSRWIGHWKNDFEKLELTANLAEELGIYIIIKGAYTTTVTPKRNFFFNSSGNPGMATAGSGDVLTGILIALLAQGYSSEISCLLGTYLHGCAGDLVALEKGEPAVIASDIIENLGKAYLQLTKIPQS